MGIIRKISAYCKNFDYTIFKNIHFTIKLSSLFLYLFFYIFHGCEDIFSQNQIRRITYQMVFHLLKKVKLNTYKNTQ